MHIDCDSKDERVFKEKQNVLHSILLVFDKSVISFKLKTVNVCNKIFNKTLKNRLYL